MAMESLGASKSVIQNFKSKMPEKANHFAGRQLYRIPSSIDCVLFSGTAVAEMAISKNGDGQ
jgi:hypothetical protein